MQNALRFGVDRTERPQYRGWAQSSIYYFLASYPLIGDLVTKPRAMLDEEDTRSHIPQTNVSVAVTDHNPSWMYF